MISRTARLLICLLGACVAMTATALAEGAIHFEPESLPALKEQLRRHEVHALSFHPAATGHIHVSLNDGRHMTVAYTKPEQAKLVLLARLDGTPVAIATTKTKTVKPAKHKLRYIAGGILLVVIIVVAAVLLVDRRRKLGEEGAEEPGGGASVPSSPGEAP
jgi:hypothetical protein